MPLCEICAGSFIGTAFLYPHQHDYDTVESLKALAFCTHLVLDAIERKDGR